jgi:hypothetical protein
MAAVFRPQPYAGPIIQLQSSLLKLFHGHYQPLTSPQALNALVIDQPTSLSKQGRDPSVPVPAILPCKFDHIRYQEVFVQSARWPPPLCGPILAKHLADPTFGYSQLATDMINTNTTTRGA